MTDVLKFDHGLPNDPLDHELIKLLRVCDHLPPFTDEELEQADRRLDENGLSLSMQSLVRTPPDPFTMKWRPLRTQCNREHSDSEVSELLARAARDGGTLTPEVEDRMRQDRQDAEQDQEAQRNDDRSQHQ